MYWRQCFLRKWLLITRRILDSGQSCHRSFKSAIVLIFFLRPLSFPNNLSQSTACSSSNFDKNSRLLSMKIIMAFPQFFGIFLVSLFFICFLSDETELASFFPQHRNSFWLEMASSLTSPAYIFIVSASLSFSEAPSMSSPSELVQQELRLLGSGWGCRFSGNGKLGASN